MDTEKQRQCRGDDVRLTKSGNARSEQLLLVLTNREWLPGELLTGSKRWSTGWFLDMKYQTCLHQLQWYMTMSFCLAFNCLLYSLAGVSCLLAEPYLILRPVGPDPDSFKISKLACRSSSESSVRVSLPFWMECDLLSPAGAISFHKCSGGPSSSISMPSTSAWLYLLSSARTRGRTLL